MILAKDVKRKLAQYFKETMGMYDYRRGWMRGDCPECGVHKFGVNLTINRTNCFRCAHNPRPIDVIVQNEGFNSTVEAFHFLKTFEGLDYFEPKIEIPEIKENASLPDFYRNIKSGKSQIAKSARSYLSNRGFDINELARRGVGYCYSGRYSGYIILPFYYKGKLIYFNARKFLSDGPKFNNPKVEDFGIGKSMLMFNADSLYLYDKCFLFESVTNCLTLGDNSFATGGKKLSRYQINFIIKSPCNRIIIGLDRDGIEDAIDVALKLVRYKKVKILQFEDERDVNDLGREATLRLEEQADYLSYGDIIKLKNSLWEGSRVFI